MTKKTIICAFLSAIIPTTCVFANSSEVKEPPLPSVTPKVFADFTEVLKRARAGETLNCSVIVKQAYSAPFADTYQSPFGILEAMYRFDTNHELKQCGKEIESKRAPFCSLASKNQFGANSKLGFIDDSAIRALASYHCNEEIQYSIKSFLANAPAINTNTLREELDISIEKTDREFARLGADYKMFGLAIKRGEQQAELYEFANEADRNKAFNKLVNLIK
ncbi:hypothetical protein ABCL16_003440 [Vibrio parahaemolyticus]